MDDTEPPSAADASATAAVVVRSPGRTPIHLLVREPIVIGRECDGLLLDDPLMSRRHLEVGVDDGVVVVTDLGSTNGTAIDGRQVSGTQPVACGDIVTFGGSSLQALGRIPRTPSVQSTEDFLRRRSIDALPTSPPPQPPVSRW